MELLGTLLDFVLHIDVHLTTFVAGLRPVGVRAAVRDHLRRDRHRRHAVPARRLAAVRRRRDVRGRPDEPAAVDRCCSGPRPCSATSATTRSAATSGRACSSGRTRAGSTRRPSTRRTRSTRSYGGITIVVARFLPFLRTFAPFVAGVAEMTRSKFSLYNVSGGLLWVASLILAGYLFGNIPWVKANLDKIIWGAILIPGALVFLGAWRARVKQRRQAGLSRRGGRLGASADGVAAPVHAGVGGALEDLGVAHRARPGWSPSGCSPADRPRSGPASGRCADRRSDRAAACCGTGCPERTTRSPGCGSLTTYSVTGAA